MLLYSKTYLEQTKAREGKARLHCCNFYFLYSFLYCSNIIKDFFTSKTHPKRKYRRFAGVIYLTYQSSRVESRVLNHVIGLFSYFCICVCFYLFQCVLTHCGQEHKSKSMNDYLSPSNCIQ